MVDNVVLNPAGGGAVIATDEISGAQYQRIKLIHGSDGINAGDISSNNPLPIIIQGQRNDLTYVTAGIDETTNNLIQIDRNHAMIHASKMYRYYDSVTLENAGVQNYVIFTDSKYPHFSIGFDGTGVISATLSEGSNRTGTTLQQTYNSNRNSSNNPGLQIYKNYSAGTTNGTTIFTYSTGIGTGNAKMGGGFSLNDELILKTNTQYIFTVTSGTASNLCNVMMGWYE